MTSSRRPTAFPFIRSAFVKPAKSKKQPSSARAKVLPMKFPSIITDCRGSGYIRACVILLVLCIVFSAVLFYAEATAVATQLKNTVKVALDGCIMKESLEIYTFLDDGKDTLESFTDSNFEERISEAFSGLSLSDGEFVCLDAAGDILYTVSFPEVYVEDAGRLRLGADFTVTFPTVLGGLNFGRLRIPVHVSGKYYSKYE